MTEIRHLAPSHAPRAAMMARRPHDARARRDTVAMEWHRLRTIVDALLRRGAGSTDHVTASATTPRAVVVPDRAPEGHERIHG